MSCAGTVSALSAASVATRAAQSRRLFASISGWSARTSIPAFAGSAPPVRSWVRNLPPIPATSLKQEDDVIVENSFKSKSFPDTDSVESLKTASSVEESWAIKFEHSVNFILVESVILILDILYRDRDYARFYVLETIARVPYFGYYLFVHWPMGAVGLWSSPSSRVSLQLWTHGVDEIKIAFISVLHLYESFGWWRRADYLKVHFAESWNELHHLLIMEELGGNKVWFDRFLAQNIAVVYYFMTVFFYLVSPRMAYHFSECVERHAYSSYDKFVKLNKEELEKLPAPKVAVNYYMDENLYMFDEFQTSRAPATRRPKIENLYDVFVNVRDDELEHCKTMHACQTPGNLHSPHAKVDSEDGSSYDMSQVSCYGIVDCIKKSFNRDWKAETKL